MFEKNEITIEMLREFLEYNPESGKLYWKTRGYKWFEKNSRPAEHCAKAWNTKHSGKEAFIRVGDNGYLFGKIFMHSYLAHRVIWAMVTSEWPDQVDHRNGIRGDNRWINLNNVTHAQNARNSKSLTRNCFKTYGVGFHKRVGKYRAYIGRNIHLGYFDTLDEAIKARSVAENELGYSDRHGWSSKPSPYKNS